ncbi:hypothetical protein MRX96_009982 [Rhipicephalus microplus]
MLFSKDIVDTRGRYLLDKVLHMAINQSVEAAQSKSHVQELEARLKQAEATNFMYQNLRQHTMNKMQPETLGTTLLRYVNRDIMNQTTRNEDKSNQTIAALRMEIQDLKRQLNRLQTRQTLGRGRQKRASERHVLPEHNAPSPENKNLRTLMKVLQETVERLTVKNTELLAEQAVGELVGGGDSDTGENVKNLHPGIPEEG